MTRRPWLALSIVVVLAAASAGAFLLARDRQEPVTTPPNVERADGLTLLIVRVPGGPFGAVVGSTGGEDGALVLPADVEVTIPGQGESTMDEALRLPPRQAATTAANLLGVWVDHYAVLGRDRLSEVVDRAGGITVGDEVLDGATVVTLLADSDEGATTAFSLVVGGLLRANVVWEPSDVANADSPSSVLRGFEAARGAPVGSVAVVENATGVVRAEPDAVRAAVVDVFGGPDRVTVGVIVLNGSGVPGVGELVAARIVPDGFRIVISDNASSFDHDETLVVVGSADDVVLGERVRDLLGAGSVNVSVASGIAPVTVVVGKDFEG
jgi:hypothetical protein